MRLDRFVEYGPTDEIQDGFICSVKRNDDWERLTLGQKIVVSMYEDGRLTAEQFCWLFNNMKG